MHRIYCIFALLLIPGCSLDGCSSPIPPVSSGPAFPRFNPFPPALKSVDATKNFVCEEECRFFDSEGTEWVAPKGTLTDGASIPQLFLSLIGDKFNPNYRYAALIHDSYCQDVKSPYYRSKPWQEVHGMFYEALIANRKAVAKQTGKPEQSFFTDTQAKSMYLAVFIGGPRWDEDSNDEQIIIARRFSDDHLNSDPSNPLVNSPMILPLFETMPDIIPPESPVNDQIELFKKCDEWIKEKNPSIEEINEWMDKGGSEIR